jgi:hypothetical protein
VTGQIHGRGATWPATIAPRSNPTRKEWLAVHNDAVMTVLFLVLGVNLIAKRIPPLT